MRKKLPLLLMAIMPFTTFAQNAQSKISVHPKKQISSALAQPNLAYAPAAYCMPALDCTDGDLITNVTFAGINNTTACSPAGYGDYTAVSNTDVLLAGQTYPISVTVGDGWPNENVSVWIDYNKNDTFETTEFTYIGNVNTVPSGLTVTGSVPITAGTANGSYRMRVRVAATGPTSDDNTLACDEEDGYGETEDYTLAIGAPAPQGCLTSPNGQWPSAAFTPTCNGSAVAVTPEAWTGEYSVINVTNGTAYTFSVSNTAYFITIANSTGTTVLASGTGTVTWTANLTGTVRFYSHIDNACTSGTSATSHSRLVKCGLPPVEPDYSCDQTYDGVWDLASNITNLNTTQNYVVANDFFVPMESAQYKIQTITATVVPLAGSADIASVNVKIMSDNAGVPGTVLQTWNNVVPTITPLTPTFASYPTFNITMDLGNYTLPVNPAADTRYWVSVQVNSASATPSSTYWIGYKYTEGWITKPNYQSIDGGTTFTMTTSTTAPGQHYDSNWSIDAECASAAVSEAGNRAVSYHPNPVKDYLTINSKKAIETVHIYNVAGQKMPVPSKLVNGKLDMSKLAPGVYIISTVLDGGKNESFKVIKK